MRPATHLPRNPVIPMAVFPPATPAILEVRPSPLEVRGVGLERLDGAYMADVEEKVLRGLEMPLERMPKPRLL